METQIKLDYETVLYYEGSTEEIPGFGDDSPYYDNKFSTLGEFQTSPSEQAIDKVEKAIAKASQQKKTQPYQNTIKTLPVRISPDQVNAIRAVASNSLQNFRRFSFPTANEIKNVSSLVDLTGRNRFASQGRIPTVGLVTSNGNQINAQSPSSNGLQTSASGNLSNLIVNVIKSKATYKTIKLFPDSEWHQ